MKTYLEENKQRFLDELLELLRIPSVSADSGFKGDVRRAAEFVRDKLTAAGLDKAALHETPGHPIVYAEKMVDPARPTVLVYGHYDVQPADPYELWQTPPFEPTIRNERIYARGACDDKGQFYMHIKALEAMLATDGLPCNVKVMIEGKRKLGPITSVCSWLSIATCSAPMLS
jgi:acetylornithine deacetylase/succinyl-diaminopimelate desuccinylase-like protein